MRKFKMALVQTNPVFGDVKANLASAESKIREAAANGAKMICMPEAFSTGYHCFRVAELIRYAEPMDGRTMTLMRGLAAELGVYLVVPFIRQVDGVLENAAVLLDDEGGVVGVHAKAHMVGDEAVYLRKGDTFEVFETKYGKIGMLVCYDMHFPETSRILALKGAEIIIVPTACRDLSFFRHWLLNNFAARGIDNVLFMAGPCMVGRDFPDSPFTGCSVFISPRGEILEMGSDSQEEIVYGDIDPAILEEERKLNTVLDDVNPVCYQILRELQS